MWYYRILETEDLVFLLVTQLKPGGSLNVKGMIMGLNANGFDCGDSVLRARLDTVSARLGINLGIALFSDPATKVESCTARDRGQNQLAAGEQIAISAPSSIVFLLVIYRALSLFMPQALDGISFSSKAHHYPKARYWQTRARECCEMLQPYGWCEATPEEVTLYEEHERQIQTPSETKDGSPEMGLDNGELSDIS